ncbi:MAG TPA: protein translocase subunit SecD [Oscillospiraceae bacterium]|nr:protein translocase subunit SecD [Oscillospiraceae bacterium]
MRRNRLLILILIIGLLLVGSAAAIWQAANSLNLGLDLRGGVYVLYRAAETEGAADDADKLARAITIIRTRVDALGVAEPNIQKEGQDRIRVELPGIEDQRVAREVIGKTALLKFVGPDGETIVSGDELKDAFVSYDQYNRIAVSLEFNAVGSEKFAQATEKLLGQQINIYLDEDLISDPGVNTVIPDGKAQITGNFTAEEASNLALQLRSGALPVKLEELEIRGVGPQLGRDSLARSVRAGIAGIILVLLFMLVYYRALGLMAGVSLVVYAAIVLGVMSALKVTLTLPGIAGLILSVGMAVDANVIIFERIKEELSNGRTMRPAVEAGFTRAFRSIFDSNVTTLIAAVVLFQFAQGSVRGFAVTLSVGILVSMFTALVLTRFLLRQAAGTALLPTPQHGLQTETSTTKRGPNYIGLRKAALIFSILLILAGMTSLATRGLNYGVDFTGGTLLQIDLGQEFTLDEVRDTLAPFDLEAATVQKVGSETLAGNESEQKSQEVLIRTPELTAAQQDEVFEAFQERFAIAEDALLRVENVGAAVGDELQRQAVIALLLASLGMIIYITIRFEYRFAITAIIALLHDAAILLTFFALFRQELNGTFIAASLTILGYSINDTIVIYDRIRENMKYQRKESLVEIVNNSIAQSLRRTINTSLTTLLVLVTLLIFGGVTLRPFISALVVGVVFGTYSSIFIASPLWLWWKEREAKKKALT